MGLAALLLCVACGKKAPPPLAEKSPKTEKTQASVSTPPLEMATTKDVSGTETAPKKVLGIAADPYGATKGTDTKPANTVAFAPTEVKANTNIVLLIDASGSMSGPIETSSKIAYEKSVIRDLLVQPTPTGMQRSLGLRVFGSQYDAQAGQCEDSLSVAALGAIQADKIGPSIDSITARGASPVAFALQKAAADLPPANPSTDNMIILIADGGDTCNADPCAAAKQLHDGPTHAIVHVIGFDLDQKSEQQLRCVAESSDGRFFLARNVAELRSSADQALNANLPYNLRVKVFAGAAPLPTQLTVYRSGTRSVVEQAQSTGIKFFQLQPGTYDILITYIESLQDPKPSKLLTGVEIQGSARAEQVVNFELGMLDVDGIDPNGVAVPLTYTIRKSASSEIIATFQGDAVPKRIALTPGSYAATAAGPSVNDIPLTATVDPIPIHTGETAAHTFRFETGELFLRGQTSSRVFVPATYAIVAGTDANAEALTKGTIPPEGKALTLPVGHYAVRVTPQSALLQRDDPEIVTLDVPAREQVQQLVTFPVGVLQLIGKDGDGTPAKTEFQIRHDEHGEVIAREVTLTDPVRISLAPELYHVTAVRVGSEMTPAPTIVWEDVEIHDAQSVAKESIFYLGTLNLSSRDAKGQPLATEFTVYRPGIQEPLVTQRASNGTTSIRVTPGLYDVQAQDVSSNGDVKPTIWINEIPVTSGATSERSVTFTSGRIRLTCRGTNDTAIPCHFRIFTYGQDAPLFAGNAQEKWREFEMKPGYYYMEIGHNDHIHDHLLKKWVNITVDENQTVEEVIRF